jgi:hypothetical protein
MPVTNNTYNRDIGLDTNEGTENTSSYPELSMFTALTMLNDEFAVEMDDDTFIERAYKIWRTIGNKAQALHILTCPVDENKEIMLPNNVENIESVSSLQVYKDIWGTELIIFNNTTAMLNSDYLVSVITDDWLGRTLLNQSRARIDGLYVDYTHNGDRLTFKAKDTVGTHMLIIYGGVISDDQALPKVTYRECEAIAAGVAYIHYKKQALMGDSAAAQMLVMLKDDMNRLIGQARIPDSINNNTMDRILDANGSFDRKNYGRTYKYNG